jgi:hypothetical protein
MPLPPRFVFDTLLRSDFIYWVMVTLFPETVQNVAGLVPKGYVLDPAYEAVIKQILKGSMPVSKRIDGFIFETYTTAAEFQASISATSLYPLSKIETPVLVINALDDPITIPENVRGLVERMPDARLGAENVAIEEFTLAPEACLSPFPGVLFMVLAVLLNISTGRLTGVWPWLTASAALVFSILGYGFFFLSATYFIGLITLLALSILQLTGLIIGSTAIVRMGTLGWVSLVYPIAPSIIYVLFATRGKKNGGSVPGAMDNLSACALAVAMCRFLAKNPSYIPDDTEIRFITFGSEEVGLRGSRRYVERHLDELKRLDARVLNYEMVVHPEIAIFPSEVNGTVKNSPEMVKSVVAAAERAGVPYRVKPAFLGIASDASPFSRAGLKATTLNPFKLPQQMVAYYHQKWDTPEVLTIEPLLNVLKLTFEWVCNGGE